MERTEIFAKLNEIFEDVLDLDETPNLTEETSADDIEEWDSLSHIRIVVTIQRVFNIRIGSTEIINWKKVGDMVDTISQKLI